MVDSGGELDGLLPWASERDKEIIAAINLHGSGRLAAAAMGVAPSGVNHAMRRLRSRAALQGYAPDHDMIRPVPDPFIVKGVSTYYKADEDGNPGQWVKSTLDRDKREIMIREAVAAMSEDIPRLDPIEGPPHANETLCNLFTLTDSHVGALAWAPESGEDWDLRIAEKTLIGCFEQLVIGAPKAKLAIVNQCGDWQHYDGLAAITPLHGNILDADGRFSKMVATSIRVLRRIVDIALMTHEEVYLVVAEGNHDMAASVWLRQMFAALYEREPRLTVNDSELPYYCLAHGETMLAFHHGHLQKNAQLPLLFAAQFPKIWGATTHRYAHTGHRHHVEEKEHSGMTVIQHPTLAARDAYAARGGWIADRSATAITYHTKFGQVARNTVTPEMLS